MQTKHRKRKFQFKLQVFAKSVKNINIVHLVSTTHAPMPNPLKGDWANADEGGTGVKPKDDDC